MDYFRVGLFLRPHGVKGELKMLSLTDNMSRFAYLKEACIEAGKGMYREIMVTGAKAVSENTVLIKLCGVDSVSEAERFRNKYLCVDRAHAAKLPAGTYFVKDLIGCLVETTGGAALGVLTDVYETNANDVYVIEGKRKLSVPALKKLLDTVDTENKRIVLNADVLSEVGLFED